MDRKTYQREYMRKWRAKRVAAPAPWTVQRTMTWLEAFRHHAEDAGLPLMARELASAESVIRIYGEFVAHSAAKPVDTPDIDQK